MTNRRFQSPMDIVRAEERQRRRRAKLIAECVIAVGVVVAAGAAVTHHQLDVKPERAKQAMFETNAIALVKTFAATASDPGTTICTTSIGLGRMTQALGRPAEILVVGKSCTMEEAAIAYRVTFDRADAADRTITVYQYEGLMTPGRAWPRRFSLKKSVFKPSPGAAAF